MIPHQPHNWPFTSRPWSANGTGFQDLGGHYTRHGLMNFRSDSAGKFCFKRKDNGASVRVSYDPSSIPPNAETIPLLQQILHGNDEPEILDRFRDLWKSRVLDILADSGQQTVSID